MLRGLRFLIPGLLLVAAACGGGSPSPTGEPVRVQVTNNFAIPVDIHVVGSGINHRLGTVHPGMTATFVVPPNLVDNGAVEFLAAAPGQNTYRSGQVLLIPGRIVDMEVASVLFNSTVSVRP
ncbi:MAG: hypothetical protein ABI836_07760 [Gemmatimonadota bacterium]